jgi:hypothetical protein
VVSFTLVGNVVDEIATGDTDVGAIVVLDASLKLAEGCMVDEIATGVVENGASVVLNELDGCNVDPLTPKGDMVDETATGDVKVGAVVELKEGVDVTLMTKYGWNDVPLMLEGVMLEEIATGALLVGADVEVDDEGSNVVASLDGRAVEGDKGVGVCDPPGSFGDVENGNVLTGICDAPLGAFVIGAVEIRGSGDEVGMLWIGLEVILGATVEGETTGDLEGDGSNVAGARVTGVSEKAGDAGAIGGEVAVGFSGVGGGDEERVGIGVRAGGLFSTTFSTAVIPISNPACERLATRLLNSLSNSARDTARATAFPIRQKQRLLSCKCLLPLNKRGNASNIKVLESHPRHLKLILKLNWTSEVNFETDGLPLSIETCKTLRKNGSQRLSTKSLYVSLKTCSNIAKSFDEIRFLSATKSTLTVLARFTNEPSHTFPSTSKILNGLLTVVIDPAFRRSPII